MSRTREEELDERNSEAETGDPSREASGVLGLEQLRAGLEADANRQVEQAGAGIGLAERSANEIDPGNPNIAAMSERHRREVAELRRGLDQSAGKEASAPQAAEVQGKEAKVRYLSGLGIRLAMARGGDYSALLTFPPGRPMFAQNGRAESRIAAKTDLENLSIADDVITIRMQNGQVLSSVKPEAKDPAGQEGAQKTPEGPPANSAEFADREATAALLEGAGLEVEMVDLRHEYAQVVEYRYRNQGRSPVFRVRARNGRMKVGEREYSVLILDSGTASIATKRLESGGSEITLTNNNRNNPTDVFVVESREQAVQAAPQEKPASPGSPELQKFKEVEAGLEATVDEAIASIGRMAEARAGTGEKTPDEALEILGRMRNRLDEVLHQAAEEGTPQRVFLSYRRGDEAVVQALKEAWYGKGADVWVDAKNLAGAKRGGGGGDSQVPDQDLERFLAEIDRQEALLRELKLAGSTKRGVDFRMGIAAGIAKSSHANVIISESFRVSPKEVLFELSALAAKGMQIAPIFVGDERIKEQFYEITAAHGLPREAFTSENLTIPLEVARAGRFDAEAIVNATVDIFKQDKKKELGVADFGETPYTALGAAVSSEASLLEKVPELRPVAASMKDRASQAEALIRALQAPGNRDNVALKDVKALRDRLDGEIDKIIEKEENPRRIFIDDFGASTAISRSVENSLGVPYSTESPDKPEKCSHAIVVITTEALRRDPEAIKRRFAELASKNVLSSVLWAPREGEDAGTIVKLLVDQGLENIQRINAKTIKDPNSFDFAGYAANLQAEFVGERRARLQSM